MRILSHVHIYYKEMWPELQKCLTNVMKNNQCDLYVTMVEKHEDLITDIKSFYPDTNIEIVENKGFDIAPFIYVLNKINLDNYDLLVKLHTKRNIPTLSFIFNGYYLGGNKWRNCLLSFCKNEKNWNKSLELLKNPNITMVSNYCLITKASESIDINLLNDFKKRFEIENDKNHKFVSGTMFVCKAELFKKIQHKITFDEFGLSSRDNSDKLPFLCEIIFGCLNKSDAIVSYDGKSGVLEKFLTNISKFVYRHKVTDKKETVKIFGIPVYKKNKK